MEKTKIFYLLALMAIFTSCHQEETSSQSDVHMTLKVDSIKIYDAKKVPKGIFMFSPLKDKNRIWTVNTTNPHELDLVTGAWTPLTKRFGNKLKGQLRADGIWRDDYTGETYLSCFHHGLIRYYPKKDTFDFLGIHPVTAFYPRKKDIALGTAHGLYLLNRNENKTHIAENFPVDIWVTSIDELTDDTLVINHNYYYVLTSHTYGTKSIGEKSPEIRSNYNYISREVRDKLPTLDGGFREFKSDSLDWYYKDSELFFSADQSNFYKFPFVPEGHIRYLLEDTDYLYVLFNEIFVIFNKDYIFEKSKIHEVADYKALQTDLRHRRTELYDYEMDIDKYLAKAIPLYNDKKYSAYTDLEYILKSIPSSLEYNNYRLGVG